MEVFQDYAYYYNAFYKDKDYRKEAETVDFLLKKYADSVKPEKVINFGCGTGRHDMELAKGWGYKCTGIDMSPFMIDIAVDACKKSDIAVDYEVADIRGYEPRDRYDAVISLFHVMSYQTRNKDIEAAFKSARKALDKGGLFLFDVWYGPGVVSDKPSVRVKEIEDENYSLIRVAKPAMYDTENVVDVNYEVFIIDKQTGKTQTISELHRMRYFFKPELEMLLEQSGFELVDNLDCDSLEKTNYNSWTSYFVAKAV